MTTTPDPQATTAKRIALIGTPGCGKAQPLTAKVLTPAGWALMGDLVVGDEVIDPSGGVATIVQVAPQGKRKIYRVEFSDGSSTECDLNHLWATKTRANKPWIVRPLSECVNPDLSLRGDRKYIPLVEELDLGEGDPLPVDPYLLGLLLGDGCMAGDSLNLTTADDEIVKSLNSGGLPSGIIAKPVGNTVCAVSENPVRKGIETLGLRGHRSYEKFIPYEYKFSSFDNRLALLQGLMDSDGGVSASTTVKRSGSPSTAYTSEFSSTSQKLASDVQFLVQSLGGRCKIAERRTKYTYKGQHLTGRLSYRMNISLRPELVPFRLKRKVDLWKKRQLNPSRKLVKVSYTGEKDAKCIILDSNSQLYVTDDFIVTHNSTVAQALQSSMGSVDYTVATCFEYAREYLQKYGTIEHPAIQSSIAFKQMRREDVIAGSCDLLISDSPIFFSHIYTTLVVDPTSRPQMKIARDIYKWTVLDQLLRYSSVIYLPRQFEVVDDGIRDPSAHDDIESIVLGFIGTHKHLFKDYVEIRSEFEDPKEILRDRVKLIRRHLKKIL